MLVLHGWGNILTKNESSHIDRYILEKIGKEIFTILYVPFAKWIQQWDMFLEQFKSRIAPVTQGYVINYSYLDYNLSLENNSYSQSMFHDADLIYIAWWDPTLLSKSLYELNITDIIFQLTNDEKKLVVGKSAWALIFFDKYIAASSSIERYWWDELIDWSGPLPYYGAVHFSERNRKEMLIKVCKADECDGFWIDEDVILFIDQSGVEVVKNNDSDCWWLWSYEYNNDCFWPASSTVLDSIQKRLLHL